jgi:alkanesulfonate monooxygenase SsuD/methylene tetrahydromethanopterin reductase-like flavin-dependent oxidoreductase (luciferase family)
MGPQSTRATLLECARLAERAAIDHLWVADHVAIPSDQAEGSGGRYLDPLATLAFLAAATEKIGLGTGVLVVPYRPPLATAKWIATIQELSGGRFHCGVGAGWMEPEFRVVGVARERRGAITDHTLEFLHRCFAANEVEEAGVRFLFLPRPKRPPIYVGGSGRPAMLRAARFGDGAFDHRDHLIPLLRADEGPHHGRGIVGAGEALEGGAGWSGPSATRGVSKPDLPQRERGLAPHLRVLVVQQGQQERGARRVLQAAHG